MERAERGFLGRVLDGARIVCVAVAGAGVFFMVLPVLQAVTGTPKADLLLTTLETAEAPPPTPPPPEEEEAPEEKPEEKPPELTETAPPLDLQRLETALDPGLGDGLGGDFVAALGSTVATAAAAATQDADALFGSDDLDQKPRVVHQPSPTPTAETRKKSPGKVVVVFVVERDGRVAEPVVKSATDPVFERPALAAIRQWRFEPGKRQGKPVRFRMRVPLTFPKG